MVSILVKLINTDQEILSSNNSKVLFGGKMRHLVAQRKLGMKTAHRKAVLSNLASSLVLHERIETTLPRAKELRKIADKVITLSKRGTVHAMRRARVILKNTSAVQKAFNELAERFADRKGGYTRILKLGYRHGDASAMAVIEYIPSHHKKSDSDDSQKGKKARKKSSFREKIFKRETEKSKRKSAKENVENPSKVEGEKTTDKKMPSKRAKKTK